jgi:hypothetical protein
MTIALLFTSCIGVKTDITIKRDLSGTARLVYTVSRELLDSGTLDGNKNWPTVPVGKADFERTVARIDGLTLRSYRARDKGGDRLFEVTLAFDNVAALAGFLSAGGQQFAYKNENGRHVFTVLFHNIGNNTGNNMGNTGIGASSGAEPSRNNGQADDALSSLARTAFSGYQFEFSLAVPGDKKTYSVPMGDLVTSAQQERMEISF